VGSSEGLTMYMNWSTQGLGLKLFRRFDELIKDDGAPELFTDVMTRSTLYL
jgi:hypothetical protein